MSRRSSFVALHDAGRYDPPQHEPSCLIWMTKAAHRARTTGRRGTSKLSKRGGDISEIAHTKRLENERADFKRRLLAKDAGEPPPTTQWPKRKLQSRNDLRRHS